MPDPTPDAVETALFCQDCKAKQARIEELEQERDAALDQVLGQSQKCEKLIDELRQQRDENERLRRKGI